MDILLVLGDVPQTQYEPLKRAMKRATGKVPKVVVVPWEYATTQTFVEETVSEFHQRYPDGPKNRAQAWFLAARPGQLEEVHINRMFGSAGIDDVKAIVFGARPTDEYFVSGIEFGWLTRRIPLEIAEYRVMPSDSGDGTLWLVGSGFGDLYKK